MKSSNFPTKPGFVAIAFCSHRGRSLNLLLDSIVSGMLIPCGCGDSPRLQVLRPMN